MLREGGVPIVFVLGHPWFYPKFGFTVENTEPFQSIYKGPHFFAVRLRAEAVRLYDALVQEALAPCEPFAPLERLRAMQARAAAMSAKGINERIEAEGALTRGLGRLMAVAEAYPTLKADGGFMRLQGDLSDTENRIASRRTGFNAAAAGFNELLSVFPNNIVAGIFGFRAMSFLKEDDEAVRSAPQVKF
jgi:hypothetical protein